MKFSDKLTDLLNMTGTTTTSLAKALNMDRSNISRMKTGARGMPKPDIIQSIAEYFTQFLTEDHLLSALYELTSDARLQSRPTGWVLTNVIFNWLATENSSQKIDSEAGHFLNTIDNYTPMAEAEEDNDTGKRPIAEGSFVVYYDNEGKRQAFRDFISYILSIDKGCTLEISSDESMDWIIEDAAFIRDFSRSISQLVDKGCMFHRIQPPVDNLELSFRSLERWIPAYMAGAITQYYYPFVRDNLYRRTLFIAPKLVALQAFSLNGQKNGRMTLLTTDRKMIDALSDEFSDQVSRCRHMMNLYTMEEPDKLFNCLLELSKVEDTGIYKSNKLSIATLPPQIIDRIARSGQPYARQMAQTLQKRIRNREKQLENHVFIDMIHFVPAEVVMAGKLEIPGTKMIPGPPFYYTPEEYILHLEHIRWSLEHYPHYQLVVTNTPMLNKVIVYVKGINHAILVKHNAPFAIIEITEQHMAASMYDYLRHIADENMSVGSRHATIAQVEAEIRKYKELIGHV